MKKTFIHLITTALLLLPMISMATGKTNDFKTITRVHFVLDCMEAHPKLNVYESSTKCSCVVDDLATKYPEKTFEEISAGFRYKHMPADRGGEFRDDKKLKTQTKAFYKDYADAYKSCHLK